MLLSVLQYVLLSNGFFRFNIWIISSWPFYKLVLHFGMYHQTYCTAVLISGICILMPGSLFVLVHYLTPEIVEIYTHIIREKPSKKRIRVNVDKVKMTDKKQYIFCG